MQTHTYLISNKKVVANSSLIWLAFVAYLGIGFYSWTIVDSAQLLFVAVCVNVFLGSMAIYGVVIHLNYYKYSTRSKLEITYDKISYFKDGKLETEIQNKDVSEIRHIIGPNMSKFSWDNLSYFVLIDKNRNSILVPIYIMDLGEFWLDTLTRKVSNDNIVIIRKWFPYIKHK